MGEIIYAREEEKEVFFLGGFLLLLCCNALHLTKSREIGGEGGKMNLNHENLFSLTHIRQSTLAITILFFHGVRSL